MPEFTRRFRYCSPECAKDAIRKTSREHMRTVDPKKKTEAVKRSHRKLITKTKDYLGGKCVYCGCDNYDALEFNHIEGGGTKEYKTKSVYALCREVLKGERDDDIELACIVCNAMHNAVFVKGLPNGWTVLYKNPEGKDRSLYRWFEREQDQ